MVTNLSDTNSILCSWIAQIRDSNIQQDRMRFRRNMERIGEIAAYELSKYLPYEEVNALMELLVNTIRREAEELKKNNVRLHVIGDFASLPEICQQELNEAKEITSTNTGLNLVLALSYSSRWEIMEAAKKFAQDVKDGKAQPGDMNDELFHKYLATADFPDPELMIRTSGENRISNYLLYQLAYAELYFTPVHWPAFRKQNLYEALLDYQQRERRFGKTSEQIQKNTTQHA